MGDSHQEMSDDRDERFHNKFIEKRNDYSIEKFIN